jgi:hypothetical protein
MLVVECMSTLNIIHATLDYRQIWVQVSIPATVEFPASLMSIRALARR